ncbi:hypothetical protein [Undibacterium sp. CY21W]|uniref:hypothetical protein n=1 Tax=Undibacterium sp. CY21W TaxID=2762293 RepID=UPI00164A0DF9|nr:hypothetical protein [Undibacterium sp. CY21W]MBC3929220.1 hypothetical protein [Undibacterium sp. CY21W]
MRQKRPYLLRNKGPLNIPPGVYFWFQKPFLRVAGIKKVEPVAVPLMAYDVGKHLISADQPLFFWPLLLYPVFFYPLFLSR